MDCLITLQTYNRSDEVRLRHSLSQWGKKTKQKQQKNPTFFSCLLEINVIFFIRNIHILVKVIVFSLPVKQY